MIDPVVAPDGHTWGRAAITEWVREHGTSPLSRERFKDGANTRFIQNFTLRRMIDNAYEKAQGKPREVERGGVAGTPEEGVEEPVMSVDEMVGEPVQEQPVLSQRRRSGRNLGWRRRRERSTSLSRARRRRNRC